MKDSLLIRKQLRQRLRQQRSALSISQQKQRSKQIASHIIDSSIFKDAHNIAFYLAVNAEANPESIKTPSTTNKQFYLPVLAEDDQQGLLFAPLHDNSQLKNNKFSIPEPICPSDERILGQQLDLVLVPLLGFDRKGNRVGMGGGFYDRCFSFKNTSKTDKPILLGFAYGFQEVDSLQAEDWDVALDYVVNEDGLFKCDQSSSSVQQAIKPR